MRSTTADPPSAKKEGALRRFFFLHSSRLSPFAFFYGILPWLECNSGILNALRRYEKIALRGDFFVIMRAE